MASSGDRPLRGGTQLAASVREANPGVTAASSGDRSVAYHLDNSCSRLFRRRRLLAFLRCDNLPATFDSLVTEAFFDVRSLQCMVEDGRWKQARAYIYRFVPDAQMGVEARTVLRFLYLLNILDDLARGEPAGDRMVDYLDKRIDADPSIMDADPHYGEVLRTIFHMHSHPQDRDSLDWKLVRRRSAEHAIFLIRKVPELSHLLRMPRCPINPHATIPFMSGLSSCRRFQRKNVRRMKASLLARRFQPQKRPTPSASGLGSCKPTFWLETMIHDALIAGEQKKVKEHSLGYSCGEDTPVAINPGKKHAITSANAGTKRSRREDCYSESVSSAKRPCPTEYFFEGPCLMFEVPDTKNVSAREDM